MKQLYRVKISTSIVVVTLAVTISFELKSLFNIGNTIFTILVILISFFIGTIFSIFLSNVLIGLQCFRRIILRNKWIEGYWYLRCHGYPNEATDNILNRTSIGEISFDMDNFSFRANTYGFTRKNKKFEVLTHSVSPIMLEDNSMNYVNHFKYGDFDKTKEGIGFGHFVISPSSKEPDFYDGIVITLDGELPFRQKGKKISNKTINTYKKKYGTDWKAEYLRERELDDITTDNLMEGNSPSPSE